MENTLFELAAKNGIWAALFVFLFIYVLYDTRRREKKYQETITENQKAILENQSIIKQLTEKFDLLSNIQKDVLDIKIELKRR